MEDTSSIIGDSTIEIVQHIASDHMDMVRFRGLEDREYEKVAAAFRRISQVIEGKSGQFGHLIYRYQILTFVIELCLEVGSPCAEQPKLNAAAIEELKKAFLDSLSFQQIDARLLNIKKAHDWTCKWLFEQLEYKLA